MTFSYRHRKQIIILSILFILALSTGIVLFQKLNIKKSSKKENLILTAKQEEKEEEEKVQEEEELYQVDIKGQVNAPGIYSVKKESRVIDVIRLAGNLTDQADTSVINLSKKVKDEMVIIVYSKEEVINFTKTKEEEQIRQENCIHPQESLVTNDACIEQEETNIQEKVSLNTATKEQLMTLSGIGEAKAEAILKYREENGPFQTIEEIMEISGIGEELFAKIKENITL